jgi:hypothetical protein
MRQVRRRFEAFFKARPPRSKRESWLHGARLRKHCGVYGGLFCSALPQAAGKHFYDKPVIRPSVFTATLLADMVERGEVINTPTRDGKQNATLSPV